MTEIDYPQAKDFWWCATNTRGFMHLRGMKLVWSHHIGHQNGHRHPVIKLLGRPLNKQVRHLPEFEIPGDPATVIAFTKAVLGGATLSPQEKLDLQDFIQQL